MLVAEPRALLRKLNPTCTKALEGAASACIGSRHYEVTVEHLLSQLLVDPNADLHLICHRYGVDDGRLRATLQRYVRCSGGATPAVPCSAASSSSGCRTPGSTRRRSSATGAALGRAAGDAGLLAVPLPPGRVLRRAPRADRRATSCGANSRDHRRDSSEEGCGHGWGSSGAGRRAPADPRASSGGPARQGRRTARALHHRPHGQRPRRPSSTRCSVARPRSARWSTSSSAAARTTRSSSARPASARRRSSRASRC